MFKKVLIANRGEIALRVIRACKELGIKTVAIHSEVDALALHVRAADEKVCVGPAESALSYRNIPNVLSAAEITGVDAIHPGYGFLSENAHFAEVCESIGIKFIGPSSENIAMMGDKAKAREIVAKRGLPVTPGSPGELRSEEDALQAAQKIGFPVIIKATAGGGGRGMRVVNKAEDLGRAFQAAQAEAKSTFGNDGVYLERYFLEPRHIEVQILADQYGRVVHLGERDCSIQRRHQKLVEETPSPAVDDKLRTGNRSSSCGGGEGSALPKCGHRRIFARQRSPVLFHGSQYPHPGGTSNHRDGDRYRSDQGTDPFGRRSTAFYSATRCDPHWP